jgi:hypothetical protein
MKDRITIEINRFTGIEEMTPEVVYLPFATADEHPYRKFHDNAWSASVDSEIVMVKENLEELWENLGGIVIEQLSPEEPVDDNGWVTSGDLPDTGDFLDNGPPAEEEEPLSQEEDGEEE